MSKSAEVSLEGPGTTGNMAGAVPSPLVGPKIERRVSKWGEKPVSEVEGTAGLWST